MIVRLAIAVMLCIAFAGCADNDAAAPPDEPTPETGMIAGVVVDERIQALPDVLVSLEPVGLTAKTDLFGRFDFRDLKPGDYDITATLGTASTSVSITLEAGERERPRLSLSPDRPKIPVHETLSWQGYKELHAGPVDNETDPAKQSLGTNECSCDFQFAVDPDLVSIVLEAVWQDSIEPGAAEPTQYEWSLQTPDGWRASGMGANPLRAEITEASFAGGDGAFSFASQSVLQVTLEPGPNWVAAQQEFQLFVTTWMVAPPPEAWSWVRGDA